MYSGCALQLKISYSVHQNLNVKANNDRSFDFTLPAGQQPDMTPPQAGPQVRDRLSCAVRGKLTVQIRLAR